MSSSRLLSGLVALLVLCSSPVRHAHAQTSTERVKIGWIGHLTGVLSAYGQDMLRAAEMAVDDVNSAGGVRGRRLELVVRDDRGDPSQAATLVRELDTQEHVLAVSGSMSADVSKALRGYAENNRLPYISASSGDASLTAPGTQWTQRMQPPAAVQGAAMAKFALSRNPNAKIAVLRHDILFFPEVMNGAIWYMEKTGQGKLVYNQYFPPRQADFNVVAAQLKEAQPDYIIFAFNPPGLENFIRAVEGAGFKPEQIICFTVQTAPAQKALAKDIIGTYAATFFDESLREAFPDAGKLSDRFFATRGYYPGYIVGNAYGTIRMIADAASTSGTFERADLVKALRSVELTSASGEKVRFDENGRNTLNTVYIVQAIGFDDKRLASFALRETIRFDLSEVPDLELAKARK